MARHFQSVNNLFRDFTINLFAGFFVAAIPSILGGNPWWSILVFVLLLITSILYLLFSKYKRLFKLMKACDPAYYYSFDLAENSKVYSEVKDSFCYLGISANSILELFRKWISESPPVNNYFFLLMNPESAKLKQQIAFEKGVSLDTRLDAHWSSSNTQLSQMIEDQFEAEKERIQSAIKVLKNLSIYKEGKLMIRLYDEFIPWWMYLIDDKKIYLGILEKGRRGQESPVMIMTKHPDFPSPCDPFKNTWDRMWADADKVV